jgi:hypothetical protein
MGYGNVIPECSLGKPSTNNWWHFIDLRSCILAIFQFLLGPESPQKPITCPELAVMKGEQALLLSRELTDERVMPGDG